LKGCVRIVVGIAEHSQCLDLSKTAYLRQHAHEWPQPVFAMSLDDLELRPQP